MKKIIKLLVATGLVGGLTALTYFIFSLAVEDLQDFIWFTVAQTDEYKFMAIPTAIVGGLAMAGTLHYLHAKGHQELGHAVSAFATNARQINTIWVWRALLIGLVSLVAGASLGPEAVLLPVSYGIGYLLAKAFKLDKPEQFGMIGIIALLAAFFNSYAAALVPLALIAYKKSGDIKKSIVAVTLGYIAVFASIGILRLLNEHEGYVTLDPIGPISVTPVLIGTAILISAIATLVPFLLDAIITPLKKAYDKISKHWIIGGLVAGLGIGIVYYLLGPVAFFSGHTGLNELLRDNSEYTSLQLAGLAIGKLLVTAWSVATIYRGGVIFPLLFVGMSTSLLLSGGIPDSSWLVTLLVATFFGIFTGSLGSLVIAAAFVLSLFGSESVPLVIAAAIGSLIIKVLFKSRFAAKSGL